MSPAAILEINSVPVKPVQAETDLTQSGSTAKPATKAASKAKATTKSSSTKTAAGKAKATASKTSKAGAAKTKTAKASADAAVAETAGIGAGDLDASADALLAAADAGESPSSKDDKAAKALASIKVGPKGVYTEDSIRVLSLIHI